MSVEEVTGKGPHVAATKPMTESSSELVRKSVF